MLSDADIVALVADHPEAIAPYDETALRPSSYVLALGDSMAVDPQGPARVAEFDDGPNLRHVGAVDGVLRIEPQQFVLASSRERLALPPDVAGLLSLGSRLARLGLIGNAGATLVQAGYGHDEPSALTFELFNASQRTVDLIAGMPFCHLVLFRHERPARGPYSIRPVDRGAGPRPARFE
jgi:dCTP deaminase